MTHSYKHEGAEVTSNHELASYMPALAAAVVKVLGVPHRMAVADFLGAVEHRVDVFPPDLKRAGRDMRLNRLLRAPVRVGDVVLSLEVREKLRMYDKTRSLVTEHGALPPSDSATGHRAARRPASPATLPAPAAPPALVAPGDPRLQTLEAVVRSLVDRVDALERATAWCALPDAESPLASAPEPAAPRPALAAVFAPDQGGACDQDVPPPGGWRRYPVGPSGPPGGVLPHHRTALLVVQHEANLARVFAARGVRVPVAEDPVLSPVMGFRDAAARADRLWRTVLQGRDALGIQLASGSSETWPPAVTWEDLRERVFWAQAWLYKVRSETSWIDFYEHPELRVPDAYLDGNFEVPEPQPAPQPEFDPEAEIDELDEERGE